METSTLLSAITALRNSIAALNKRSDALEHWLYICVALVVIGVAAEVVFIFWEYQENLKDFHRGTIRSPEKPSVSKLIMHMIAASFVAIGVGGEFCVDWMAGEIQTDLRNKNGELNRLLSNASSVALRDAAHAIQAAAEAEGHLAQANARAESANALAKNYEAQIADSNARTKAAEALVASANKMAEEARSMAESERLERIRLERQIAPRRLSVDQQRRIADSLRQFVGHRVLVTSYALDVESAILGQQIISVLRSVLGNQSVLDNRASVSVAGGFDLGLHIRSAEPSERDFVAALDDAFRAIGGLTTFVNRPRPRLGAMMSGGGAAFPRGTVFVEMVVGPKPP
jgi:anti-sigma28 factor (negative regulator of flagellin synthesis)